MTAEPRPAAAGAAQAALLVAALLFVSAWPAERRSVAECAAPAELHAERGWTRAVSCSGGPALRGPARLLYGQALDPNRDDAATLEVLPGIGATRARAILDARAERPFAEVGDLRRVPGIGATTLARIAPYLAVTDEPGVPSEDRR
ncbi:MAG TPA: helix-hairpin-helix domain-containing protein [Myxococcota bacterium]|nr:helix-hairpin-helix domain-containing protein [Myxococcota bacterium]